MPGHYRGPADMPGIIPVFPLSGALLLPRSEMPLNIFEPRYLAMIDSAISSHRIIGMVQPVREGGGDRPALARIGCAGRITAFSEQPDGRILVTLTGITRFAIVKEQETGLPWREVEATYDEFAGDFEEGYGEDKVDRNELLGALRSYLDANGLKADWSEVAKAGNETLVNTLAMLAPYDNPSKQALLEAPDLKTRADVLVALTEVSLARDGSGQQLQ
jgi:Lon protease-like protein